MNLRIFAILFLAAIYLSSCNDPTAVGSDLLDEDQANIGFTDTFAVDGYTAEREPVRVHSGFSDGQQLNILFGNFNDPVFGRSSSTINAQVIPITDNPGFLENTGIDSVLLYLPYNVFGAYGKLDEEYGMEVYELDERLRADDEYFSDYEAMIKPEVLGSILEVPSIDSIPFITYGGADPDTLYIPHMSVPIDPSIVEDFISMYEQDTTFFMNDSLFLSTFNGFQLKPTTENAGMLSFDMFNDIGTAFGGLYVFYKDTADVSKSFRFPFNLNDRVTSFPQYTHDYNGSIAEPYIGQNGAARDSLLFIQGMAGVEPHIELPPMDELKGTIINKAELEFFIRDFTTGDTLYLPSSPVVLTTVDEQGELQLIADAASALNRGLNLAEVFGGIPTEQSEGPMKYRMNITAHLQDVIDGIEGREMVLIPLGKSTQASRVVLYGPSHPEYGISLKITYTEL